jgi:glycosyltransferase involved in cell wall biosynthesis
MSGQLHHGLISIGIPTFNRATDLGRAILSALAQDYQDLEVVISDNASTDGTESLCRQFSSQDKRVRYIRQPTNRGVTENFRSVLEHAQGRFFMWLGDDDWIESSYVSSCIEAFASDPAYSLVSGLCRYYQSGVLNCLGERIDLQERSGSERVLSYYRTVIRNGTFYGVMRKDLISQVPLRHVLGADWLLIAAMAYLGKIKTLETTFVNRSISGQSSDRDRLLSLFPLSEFQKANPFLTIAGIAFSDIASQSPVYAPLGPARRLAVAARVAMTIVRRHHHPRLPVGLVRQMVG